MTITRYDVTPDRRIRQSGRMSLAAVGVTWMHYRALFFGPTRAYYVDNTAGQIVVWNPRDMTITKTFELPAPVVEGYEGYETILPFYKFPVVNGRLFIPVSWVDRTAHRARNVTGLVVVDTETDSVISYSDYYHPLYSLLPSALQRGSTWVVETGLRPAYPGG